MNIEKYLPIAAPAPAGLIIGIHLYNETMSQIGKVAPESYGPVAALAMLFAACGCFGMIFCEITAYKQAGIALAENQKKAALIALLAGMICSALVIWAVWTGDGARAVVSSVVISIAGYIALASRDFLARRRGVAQAVETSADKDKSFTLGMEKERTNQARAAARMAKAAGGSVQSVSSLSTGQNPPPLDAATLEAARVYFAANPAHSAREWLKSPGCPVKSPTTASVYKKAVTP